MISRRAFLQGTTASLLAPVALQARQSWPPVYSSIDAIPARPPYLVNRPAVVPIDVGRQLFVDDFLIEHTTMLRTFHKPVYHAANPVLKPEREWEIYDAVAARTKGWYNPTAMIYSDGVVYDPADRVFKLWYMGGYGQATCYAVSNDGIHWDKPVLDVRRGSNVVHPGPRDSSTVWLDHFATDPAERFKMAYWYDGKLVLSASADGIHWRDFGATGPANDRSTFFYNPFRRVWCFSVRADQFVGSISGRHRRYWEAPAFSAARDWGGREPVPWVKADANDLAWPTFAERAELYNLDAVAYESVMLGLFTIWRGENKVREKINEIVIGFSRDGFHWDRPDRSTFLGVSPTQGAWNWANVQSAGGCCLLVGDQLYFYVSGRQGRPNAADPGVCTTGVAMLRRDGFASMDGVNATLTTRPVRFDGRHLFVNVAAPQGELRVEVLDRDGNIISPFTKDACAPITGDAARMAVRWTGGSLAAVAGRDVRFRFSLTSGRLYAFWISPWPSGESRGYVAAGGPAFSGAVDRARA